MNRSWVRREHELGKIDIFELYQLAIVKWRDLVFKRLERRVLSFFFLNFVPYNFSHLPTIFRTTDKHFISF